MEDYEQKYKEALERAKGAHNSAKSDKENGVTDKITEYTIQLTEIIFPELKESEDEKIRNTLIDLFKNRLTYYGTEKLKDLKVDDILAWLEKQGEKLPAWSEEDEKIIETMCKEGNLKPSEVQWLKSLKVRLKGE